MTDSYSHYLTHVFKSLHIHRCENPAALKPFQQQVWIPVIDSHTMNEKKSQLLCCVVAGWEHDKIMALRAELKQNGFKSEMTHIDMTTRKHHLPAIALHADAVKWGFEMNIFGREITAERAAIRNEPYTIFQHEYEAAYKNALNAYLESIYLSNHPFVHQDEKFHLAAGG